MNQNCFKVCFKGKISTYACTLKQVCMRGRFSIKKGLSEIGMVIVVFSLLFWVLIPMMTFYMEMKSVQVFKEQVKTASELALTDMILALDPVELSRGNVSFEADAYQIFLNEKLRIAMGEVAAENVKVFLDREGKHDLWEISFELPYNSRFTNLKIFNQQYHAVFKYEMPMNN